MKLQPLTILLLTLAAPALAFGAEPPGISVMFESMGEALRSCEGVPGPASARAAIVAWPDGAWALGVTDWRFPAPNPDAEAKGRACVWRWETDRRRREPLLRAHRAGRAGELCAFGERRWSRGELDGDVDEVDPPAACGKGLLCCGGGAWGSDSHCWTGPSGPMLP